MELRAVLPDAQTGARSTTWTRPACITVPFLSQRAGTEPLENVGIDPTASHMQSERSSI